MIREDWARNLLMIKKLPSDINYKPFYTQIFRYQLHPSVYVAFLSLPLEKNMLSDQSFPFTQKQAKLFFFLLLHAWLLIILICWSLSSALIAAWISLKIDKQKSAQLHQAGRLFWSSPYSKSSLIMALLYQIYWKYFTRYLLRLQLLFSSFLASWYFMIQHPAVGNNVVFVVPLNSRRFLTLLRKDLAHATCP